MARRSSAHSVESPAKKVVQGEDKEEKTKVWKSEVDRCGCQERPPLPEEMAPNLFLSLEKEKSRSSAIFLSSGKTVMAARPHLRKEIR